MPPKPGHDVAGLVQGLAVDEQAGNLALSTYADERCLRLFIVGDVLESDGALNAKVLHVPENPHAKWAGRAVIQHEVV